MTSAVEMGIVAFDTSVVLAALLTWHEHHSRAFPFLRAAIESESVLVVPLPVLIEAYSVMTRLPPMRRVRAEDAHAALLGTFGTRFKIVALEADDGWTLLGGAVAAGVAGGLTYDAQVAACARKAGATELITFNSRDFLRLGLGAMTVVVP